MKKKAQINELGTIATALVAITLVLVVGFLIFAQTKEVVQGRIASIPITDETVTWINGTAVALTGSPASLNLACSAVYNNATGTAHIIGAGNYTCDGTGITLVNGSGGSIWTSKVNVTYSYKLADLAYNGTSKVQNATSTIPGWLPIIVITIVGSLLIGLVALYRRQG